MAAVYGCQDSPDDMIWIGDEADMPGVVELAVCVTDQISIVYLSPEHARALAADLCLAAKQAEQAGLQ